MSSSMRGLSTWHGVAGKLLGTALCQDCRSIISEFLSSSPCVVVLRAAVNVTVARTEQTKRFKPGAGFSAGNGPNTQLMFANLR